MSENTFVDTILNCTTSTNKGLAKPEFCRSGSDLTQSPDVYDTTRSISQLQPVKGSSTDMNNNQSSVYSQNDGFKYSSISVDPTLQRLYSGNRILTTEGTTNLVKYTGGGSQMKSSEGMELNPIVTSMPAMTGYYQAPEGTSPSKSFQQLTSSGVLPQYLQCPQYPTHAHTQYNYNFIQSMQ